MTEPLNGEPRKSGTQPGNKEPLPRLKSSVRIAVTYFAAGYLFGGSLWLVYLEHTGTVETATKDLFLYTAPVATGILTYWFGTRTAQKSHEQEGGNG